VYSTETGAVYAVPFDLERRTVTGAPVPVLDEVRSGIAFGSRLALSHAGAMVYLPGAVERGTRVVEVDRSGREQPVIARPGVYAHPRWSPGRDRIALTVSGDGDSQIWVYDVASETLSQLTSEGTSLRPTWSPDGRRLAFYSTVRDSIALVSMPADRSGPAEAVAEGHVIENGASNTFWTRDGAWIVVDGLAEPGRNDEDILAVGTGSDRTAHPVVGTRADEQNGAVSPDGRWIAYNSDEGRDWQVYVRPFMRDGGRWLISTGMAFAPLWTSNSELVYADVPSRSLIAASLELGPSVRVTNRTRLFGLDPYVGVFNQSVQQYDVSRDGQRFLMLREVEASAGPVAPIVVLNWAAEVSRRMAEQGGR